MELPVSVILNLPDDQFDVWLRQICSRSTNALFCVGLKETKISPTMLKLFRLRVKSHYHPIMSTRLNQPFDSEYGLINRKPNEEFSNFLLGPFYRPEFFLSVTNFWNSGLDSSRFFERILRLNGRKICAALLSIVSYNRDELEQLSKVYPYAKNALSYLDENNLSIVFLDLLNRNVLDPKDFKFNISQTGVLNCIKYPTDIMLFSTSVTLRFNTETMQILNEPNMHQINVIIDTTKEGKIVAFVLDSHYSEFEEKYHTLICESLNFILSQKFKDKKIFIVPFSEEKCQLDLQGRSGTCQMWSTYLFCMFMLNGRSKKEIYDFLLSYDQDDRDRLIQQFAFFIHNTIPEYGEYVMKKDFKSNIKIPHPKLWF